MAKKVYLVYQDCPMCGSRQNWGEEQVAVANKNGISIVKLGFTLDKAKELINKAVLEHGIGKMPFFTDGEHFAYELADLVGKCVKTTKKSTKKCVKQGKKQYGTF